MILLGEGRAKCVREKKRRRKFEVPIKLCPSVSVMYVGVPPCMCVGVRDNAFARVYVRVYRRDAVLYVCPWVC